jgi:hypothetical protein
MVRVGVGRDKVFQRLGRGGGVGRPARSPLWVPYTLSTEKASFFPEYDQVGRRLNGNGAMYSYLTHPIAGIQFLRNDLHAGSYSVFVVSLMDNRGAGVKRSRCRKD